MPPSFARPKDASNLGCAGNCRAPTAYEGDQMTIARQLREANVNFNAVYLVSAFVASSSVNRPFRISIGGGGHPAMWRSTGTTSDTPPTTA
jgi:hypothetical protein